MNDYCLPCDFPPGETAISSEEDSSEEENTVLLVTL